MPFPPWAPSVIGAGGLVVEAVGVATFIRDAIHLASEVISQARGAVRPAKVHSASLGMTTLEFFDGSDGEAPGGRLGNLAGEVDISTPLTPAGVRQAIWGRQMLRIGAILTFLGIGLQLAGTLMPLWSTVR